MSEDSAAFDFSTASHGRPKKSRIWFIRPPNPPEIICLKSYSLSLTLFSFMNQARA